MTEPMTDDGYLLLAIADDFAAHFGTEPVDPDDVYDWLVAQAHALTAAHTDTGHTAHDEETP